MKNKLAESLRTLSAANKYAEQGETFLTATCSTLEVIEAVPQQPPAWDYNNANVPAPIHYACKISNAHGSYRFDFWGSIHDAGMIEKAKEASHAMYASQAVYVEVSDFLHQKMQKKPDWKQRRDLEKIMREAVKPKAYDILTCLHDNAGESFEDFCNNYGYSTDSIKAEKIYRNVLEQERGMRKLFSREEMEALQEIV